MILLGYVIVADFGLAGEGEVVGAFDEEVDYIFEATAEAEGVEKVVLVDDVDVG